MQFWQSTSIGIMHLDVTGHHSGVLFCHGKVDLNKDYAPWSHKAPLCCIFLSWDGRPQQGLQTSNSQNTWCLSFSLKRWPQQGLHIDFKKHHTVAFSHHWKVDLNRDGTPLWWICWPWFHRSHGFIRFCSVLSQFLCHGCVSQDFYATARARSVCTPNLTFGWKFLIY